MPEPSPDTAGIYGGRAIRVAAARTPGVARVWVYGSAVWGGWEPGVSDTDLMVEGDESSGGFLAVALGEDPTLDIRHASELTWHHQADIRARGRLIYDRDSRESAGAHGTDVAG